MAKFTWWACWHRRRGSSTGKQRSCAEVQDLCVQVCPVVQQCVQMGWTCTHWQERQLTTIYEYRQARSPCTKQQHEPRSSSWAKVSESGSRLVTSACTVAVIWKLRQHLEFRVFTYNIIVFELHYNHFLSWPELKIAFQNPIPSITVRPVASDNELMLRQQRQILLAFGMSLPRT